LKSTYLNIYSWDFIKGPGGTTNSKNRNRPKVNVNTLKQKFNVLMFQ